MQAVKSFLPGELVHAGHSAGGAEAQPWPGIRVRKRKLRAASGMGLKKGCKITEQAAKRFLPQ